MLSTLLRGTQGLLRRALEEHATPTETALSVALGVFCSSTPLIGFHLWMALGLATVLRLNRLWAAVGSRATTMPVMPMVAFAEVQLAHRLRTGSWLALSVGDALAHARELPLDWALGTPIVGSVYAAILGGVAYGIARRARSGVKPHRPGGPPPASSGSPPSARPTPSR